MNLCIQNQRSKNMGTRFDRIKAIYKQDMLKDILLASDEDEEEAPLGFIDNTIIEEEPEEAPKPKKTKPKESPTPEKPQSFMGITDVEEDEEEGGESTGQEEPLIMPGSEIESSQLSFSFGGRKFEAGACLGKECPKCTYINRPIYNAPGLSYTPCMNCAKIFKQISRKMELNRGDEDYTPSKAVYELRGVLGRQNSRPTEQSALDIFNNAGITELGADTIREIPSNTNRVLEDLMWYKLNVFKDERTGEPEYDENGMPITLKDAQGQEARKYYSTDELTRLLHLSSERFRALIDRYNSKLLNQLPPDVLKTVKIDKSGEPLPISKRMLAQHGWAGPAVLIGTGMADVPREMKGRKEPWAELTEEEEAAQMSPAFKSVDIAAWKWETIKPAFVSWITYLQKIFLPTLQKYKLKTRRKAVENTIKKRQLGIELVQKQIKILWNKPSRAGMRALKHFRDNPEDTKESMENKWGTNLEKFEEDKKKHKQVIEMIEKLKSSLDPDALQLKENWERSGPKDKRFITNQINKHPRSDQIKADIKKLRSAEKAASKFKIPPEVNVLSYLSANPKVTKEMLEREQGEELDVFMKRFNNAVVAIQSKEEEIASLQRKRDDLLVKIQQTLGEKSFDLGEELKKFEAEESGATRAKDLDVAEEEDKIKAETEEPKPADPEAMKTSSLRVGALHSLLKLADEDQMSLWPELEPEKEPEPEGLAGTHEFRVGTFNVNPNEQYSYVVEFMDKSGKNIELKGSGVMQGKSFEEDLQNNLSKYGYHNFGAVGVAPQLEGKQKVYPARDPNATTLKVTVTNATNRFKSFYFDIQESGQIANWYGTTAPSTPRQIIPEESKKEEKALPDDTFGNQKGVYEVAFEWRGDYEWSPPAWYGKFRHSPERSKRNFEDLIKNKIEARFTKSLLKTMKSDNPNFPDTTEKKYVRVTVIEPFTEEKRIYSMLFNRLTGKFNWKSTTVEERKEKQRRLKLPEHKELKILHEHIDPRGDSMLSLDDLILVGKNGLKNIKEPFEEKVRPPSKLISKKPRMPKERGESPVVQKQKEQFEALSPEDQEYEKGLFIDGEASKYALYFKNELGLEQDPESKEPRGMGEKTIPESMKEEIKKLEVSGKCPHCDAAILGGETYCTNPDCKHPTEKGKKHLIVEEYMTWKEEREKKDRRGKPIYNSLTQEVETEEIRRRVPSYSLVTISFHKNGKPKSASCQKVNSQMGTKTDTGGQRNRPRFRDIWNKAKEEYAEKLKLSKKDVRQALIQKRQEAYVTQSQKEHPGANPYSYGRLPKVSPPKSRTDISQKARKDPKATERAKCRGWPLFREQKLPRNLEKIECVTVQAAVKFVLGEPLPAGARVWPYEEVTDVQQQDPTRSYTTPEFAADDKKASRFDRVYKLSKMK